MSTRRAQDTEVRDRYRQKAIADAAQATPDRLLFIQADRWHTAINGGQEVYPTGRCCFCYRPTRPDAVRLRTARTNDGEWWLISGATDLTAAEWKDFQTQLDGTCGPTILPIGPDCLRQHPEFEIGRVP